MNLPVEKNKHFLSYGPESGCQLYISIDIYCGFRMEMEIEKQRGA
jgi:hypothetical protein